MNDKLHAGIRLCQNAPSLFMTYLSQAQIDLWTPYKTKVKQPYDCVQNSLHFLKLIDEMVGKQQSELHNIIQKGTFMEEVIFILSQKFKHVTFSKNTFNIQDEENAEEIYSALSVMPPGFATLVYFVNKESGHAVVIAKSIANVLYLIDAQNCIYYSIDTISEFMKYVNESKYLELYAIQFQKTKSKTISNTKQVTSKKHTRGPNIQIRKESFKNPTKKRRLDLSVSKSETSRKQTSRRDVGGRSSDTCRLWTEERSSGVKKNV